GVVRREAIIPRTLEGWHTGRERQLVRGRVLTCDAVAAGRQPHHVEQRRRRFLRDVLRVDRAESTWRGAADCGIHTASIVYRRGGEYPSRFIAQGIPCCTVRFQVDGGFRERRQQQDDAEVGVRAGPARGRVDRRADRDTKRLRAGRRQ